MNKVDEIDPQLYNLTKRNLEALQENGDVFIKALATILSRIADGVIVLDQDLTIVLSNQAAGLMAHKELDNISRPALRESFKFYDSEGKPLGHDEEPIVVAMRNRQPYELEAFVTGTTLPSAGRWVRAHAAPILDEEQSIIGGVTVLQDISERVRLQKQRDYLAALISHDLKNHLAAESSFLDLLLGFLPDSVDKRMASFITELKRSNRHFVEVANSMLELSRSQFFATSTYGQSVHIGEILHNIVEMNNPIASEKNVEIIVNARSEVPPVCGIPAVLQQALHNILINALEVSSPGGTVRIEYSKHPKMEFASVEIADDGPGMEPDEVASLFDPSRVAVHRRTRTSSTGFGLYLSAILIEGQNGRLLCRSEVGKGTTIQVDIPLAIVAP